MDREINLVEYLPGFLREIEDFFYLSETENPEIVDLWEALAQVEKEQFLEDSSEFAVIRWEKILVITPNDDDTLEQRKFRIATRLSQQLPYTYNSLENNLKTICGEDGYLLQVDPVACTISIRVTLEVKFMYDEVERLLERVLPCNLLLDFRLLFNRHKDLKRFAHSQLHTMTHRIIKEEVLPE